MTVHSRRRLLSWLSTACLSLPALQIAGCATRSSGPPLFEGAVKNYHGYELHEMTVDGCAALVVTPKAPLDGKPWIWRTLFWGSFQDTDIAFLEAGFYVAYISVGNTFGCPDAQVHFDAFYHKMTNGFGLGRKPALEGLSRGGLSAYRWAAANPDKVGAIYGDAPVCDMKSWPGGKFSSQGSAKDWAEAIKVYHFSGEPEMMAFGGNPVDILERLAGAQVPIIHVTGDSDKTVPKTENTDIVRARYMGLGGPIAVIVKQGCDHHPHGLRDPAPVVDFIAAHCARGSTKTAALARAPRRGSVTVLTRAMWDYTPIKPE